MSSHSGKFVLRIPPSLHHGLSQRAHVEKLSLNALCQHLLEQGLTTESEGSWRGDLHRLIPLLQRRFRQRLLGIITFGSRVRGDETASSDLDLLIALESSIPITRELYRWWQEDVHPAIRSDVTINPHFAHPPESPKRAGSLWYEIALGHEIIVQHKNRLQKCLENILKEIQEGAVERKWKHGHPYWVRHAYEKQKPR